LDVTLPGFEIKLDGQRFEAQQNGLGVAELELGTTNAQINVKAQ
jgi:CYTH domain-containing protein